MKAIIGIFLFFYQINCLDEYIENSVPIVKMDNQTLEIGSSNTYSIEFTRSTNFTFDIKDEDIYQINIHAINCNFDIYSNGKIINQINLDTYSIQIKNESKSVIINPLIDIIDGREKKNYELQRCYLSINSFKENQPKVKIENREETIFYFEPQDSKILNLLYELKEISNDSFASLFFQLNEKCNFSININYNNENQKEIISKNISDTTYIFLSSDLLKNLSINNSNINISIIIKKIDDNKGVKMNFKIIEKEIISMIQKNALNYGFLTTEIKYQYFYSEIFKGEEGEIMLHNKRFYGELLAKIVTNDELNITDLYNSSKYPKLNDTDTTFLNYNPHSLKLIYNNNDTSKCLNGCYLLITYEQKQSEGNYPNIGYEFTLLSRTWNYSDFISSIIDIPFNEYILGAFEKDSITHHYYSIHIPKDADKIIIQYEGNYIDIFYEEGRKKINTMKIIENDKNLEIINNQEVLILNNEYYNFKNKTVSFAFRSKDYFANIFSFYYFKIFYAKNNETIYFPLDSQFGNLCLPEQNTNTNKFYCHFIFQNRYNELSKNFSISSNNLNEYFKINALTIYKNGSINNETNEIFYIYYYNNISEIDYFIFIFEFENSEIKSIVSTISESINNSYPYIYSSQMFYLIGIKKNFLYKLKYQYTLINKYIYGPLKTDGWIEVSILNYEKISLSRNYRGKPVALDINSRTNDMLYGIDDKSEFIFVINLEYIMRNKGIIEIKSGDIRSQIMESGYFPLYYYFKIKHKDYINFDVNLRLNSYDDSVMNNNFEIKGYLLDEDQIKRKIRGEHLQLKNSINGIYSNIKVGLIEANQNNTYYDNYNYCLIEINNTDSTFINSYFLAELVVKEYNKDFYFMPINRYIIETFGDYDAIKDKNRYHILVDQKGSDEVWIELSPDYNDIEIIFTNETNPDGFRCSDFNCTMKELNGFKKYVIYEINNDNIYFDVINPKKRKANYMIRYYYGLEKYGFKYYLNKMNKEYIDTNDENITLSLTFDPIEIKNQDKHVERDFTIYFYINGLLYKKNDGSEELINTTAILYEKNASYEDQTIHIYDRYHPQPFNLIFKNIPRKENCIYDLQIKINVFLEENLFNEEILIFTKEIDLFDIKLKEDNSLLWYILGPILGLIFLILVPFLVIKYIRLNKANANLQKEIQSMAYSNNVYKDVITKDKDSKEDMDYDSTFI